MAEFSFDPDEQPKSTVSIKRVAPSGKVERGLRLVSGEEATIAAQVDAALAAFKRLDGAVEEYTYGGGGD